MQCFWLFDRSLTVTVGLIMNEAMESSHIHTLLAEVIWSISLGVVIQPALIPDVCRHQVTDLGDDVCVGARWPVVMQHMCCVACVCVWQSYISQGGFQCLQPLLTLVSPTTPSPLLPPVWSDSLWSQTWVGGWDWMGSGGWERWSAVWGSVGG